MIHAAIALLPDLAHAHPLHTTLTEMTEDRAHGIVRATIRVFEDDFGTAVARYAQSRRVTVSAASRDALAIDYVQSAFSILTVDGKPIPLRTCGVRKTEGLLWVCVEGASAGGLSSVKVRNGMLSELFDDQINVVQGNVNGSRRSILFTRGDKPKSLS